MSIGFKGRNSMDINNLITCITVDNLISNSFLMFILSNLIIVLLFNEISSIDIKHLNRFCIQFCKHIFFIFIMAIIFQNLDTMQNELTVGIQNVAEQSLSIVDTLYQNFIWIAIVFFICFFADKLTQNNISDKYLNYIDYIMEVFIFIIIILKKGIWLWFLSVEILALLKIHKYKDGLNENYNKIIDQIGAFKYWTIYGCINVIFYFATSPSYLDGDRKCIFIITIFTCMMINIMIINTFRFKNPNNNIGNIEMAVTSISEVHEVNNIIEENKYETSDIPIENKEQLFPTRKREVEYISYYLKNYIKQIDEPFAISINAKWGEGKTSFANVLKKEMKEDYLIIDLQPMVTDTKEGLLKYFLGSLSGYFKFYGLYIECFPSIQNYFKTVIKLIDKENVLEIEDDTDIEDYDFRVRYNDLQEQIYKLVNESGKDILIVIDDFDRIDEEAKYEILTFIKEIVYFKKVKVLILMDYLHILKDNQEKGDIITCTFLEKFINKRFDLSILNPDEIWKYYKDHPIEVRKVNGEDKLSKELDKLSKNIYEEINSFIEKITKKEEKLNGYLSKYDIRQKKEEKESIEKQIFMHNKIKTKISNQLKNGRSTKRIIREVSDTINYITYIYSRFTYRDKEILVEEIDIKSIIITMVLIKIIYEKDYNNIIHSNSIFNYIDSVDENNEVYIILELLFGIIELRYRNLDKNIKKMEIFIDNVFLSNNTPDEVLDINNEYKRLLDIISKEDIIFENDNSVYENIMNIYSKIGDKDLNKNMSNISRYLSKQLKEGNIKVSEAIDLVCPPIDKVNLVIANVQQWAIAKNNGEYIIALKNYIEKDKNNIRYKNKVEKDMALKILENTKKIIINLNIYNMAGFAIYKGMIRGEYISQDQDIIEEYYNIINNIKDLNIREGISFILKNYMYKETEKYEDDLLVEFKNIIKSEYEESILSDICKELINMINIIQSLEYIEEIVNKAKIDDIGEDFRNMSYKQLIAFLKQNQSNLDTLDFIFDDFIEILCKINKNYNEEVSQEDIQLFYKIIEPKKKYIENKFYVEIVLIIKKIEENYKLIKK